MANNNKDWRDWLATLLGIKPDDQQELLDLLDGLRRDGGVLNEREMQMIQGVLRMRGWKIRDVMLPKNDIIHLHTNYDYKKVVDIVCEYQHSRFPVFDEKDETVVGILLAKDLLRFVGAPEKFIITEVMREAVFEPITKRLDVLLDVFRQRRSHMVIVLDEHAETAGIVTIEDVLEQIVGEIHDESDDDEDFMKIPVGGGYIIKGTLSLEEFNAQFSATLPTDTDNIASWLAAELGRMPQSGDSLDKDNLTFLVVEANERRVYTIRVTVNH